MRSEIERLTARNTELLEALKEMVKCHNYDKPECNCCECRYAEQTIAKAKKE